MTTLLRIVWHARATRAYIRRLEAENRALRAQVDALLDPPAVRILGSAPATARAARLGKAAVEEARQVDRWLRSALGDETT